MFPRGDIRLSYCVPGGWSPGTSDNPKSHGIQRDDVGAPEPPAGHHVCDAAPRFTMLLHLPLLDGWGVEPRVKNGPALGGYGAETMRKVIAEQIITMPEQLRRSLTWDRGKELAQHVQLRIDTGVAVYFVDPHSPWQRGTNENTVSLVVARLGWSGRLVPAA
jgi:hypothetical protein